MGYQNTHSGILTMNFGLVNLIVLVVAVVVMIMMVSMVGDVVAQMGQMVTVLFLVLPIKVQVVCMVVEMVAPPSGIWIIQVFLVRITVLLVEVVADIIIRKATAAAAIRA